MASRTALVTFIAMRPEQGQQLDLASTTTAPATTTRLVALGPPVAVCGLHPLPLVVQEDEGAGAHGADAAAEAASGEPVDPAKALNKLVKGTQSLEELLHVILEHGPAFNAIHLTTALFRLAELATPSPPAAAAPQPAAPSPSSSSSSSTNGTAAAAASPASPPCSCTSCSSPGKGISPRQQPCDLGEQHGEQGQRRQPQEHAARRQQVLNVLLPGLATALPGLDACGYAHVVYSLARLDHFCSPLLDGAVRHSEAHLRSGAFTAQQLSNLAWGLAKLGFKPGR